MDKGQFIESLRKAADVVENDAAAYSSAGTTWGKLFPVKTISDGYVKGVSNVFSTDFREVKNGEGLAETEDVQGYVSLGVPRTYGIKHKFDYNVIEDSQRMDFVAEATSAINTGVNLKKEKVCADMFNYGGFTTPTAASKVPFGINGVSPEITSHYATDGLIYDGKPLFSLVGTAHPSIKGATYINSIAQALSIANLKTAWTAFASTNAKDESDQQVSIVGPGEKAILLVPPALKFTAMELVNQTSLAIAAAGTNDSREFANLVEVVEWPFLTSATAWFLVKPSQFGAMALERKGLTTNVIDDPSNRCVTLTAEFRFGLWVRNWRFFHGNNVATS